MLKLEKKNVWLGDEMMKKKTGKIASCSLQGLILSRIVPLYSTPSVSGVSTNDPGRKLFLKWVLTALVSYRAFSARLLQFSCMWVTEARLVLQHPASAAEPLSPWSDLQPSTCRGMRNYAIPNLSETTRPVTRATCKHTYTCLCKNIALEASDSACESGTLVWGRWFVYTRPNVAPFLRSLLR